jgi:hypothetical protein
LKLFAIIPVYPCINKTAAVDADGGHETALVWHIDMQTRAILTESERTAAEQRHTFNLAVHAAARQ